MKQVLTLLLLVNNTVLFSQKASTRAFQLQLEAFGPSGTGSLNVDARISKKENGFGVRLGIGTFSFGLAGESCNDGGFINIPAGINYLIGKNQHLVELGAGGTILLFGGSTLVMCPNATYDFFSEKTKSYLWLLSGYRFQPVKKKGITFRFFVSPLFQKNFPVQFWGGASVGYRF